MGVDYMGFRSVPGFDFGVRTNGDDAVAQDGHRLGCGMSLVYGPDVGVKDDEVSGGLGLRSQSECAEEHHEN